LARGVGAGRMGHGTAEPKAVDAILSGLVTDHEAKLWSLLGRRIGRRPVLWLCMPLVLYMSLIPGTFIRKGDAYWLWMSMQTDFLSLFAFTHTREYKDYMRATESFPAFRQINIASTSKSGESPLSAKALNESLRIVDEVRRHLRAGHDGGTYTLGDVCVRTGPGADCRAVLAAPVLLGTGAAAHTRLGALADLEATGADAAARASFLAGGLLPQHRAFLPLVVGAGGSEFPGASATPEELSAWLLKGRVLLDTFDTLDTSPSKAFERAVQRYISDTTVSELQLSYFSTGSLGYELVAIMRDVVPLLSITIFIMLTFVIIVTGADTRIPGQTQILASAFCTGIPSLGAFAGMGMVSYLGLPLNCLCCMAPFLGLAVGIDELFLVVSAINSVPTSIEDPEEVLALALPRAGTAAFCTATTDVIAFTVGALTCTTLLGFFAFCWCLVFVLALGFIGMLTAAPASIVLNERRIRRGRRDLVPCLKRRRATMVREAWSTQSGAKAPVAADADLFYHWLCIGRSIKSIVSDRAAPFFQKSLPCQLVGASLMITMLVGSAIVFPNVGRGMPDSYFLPDEGPTQDFLAHIDTAFAGKVQVPLSVLLPKPQLHEETYRDTLKTFMEKLANHPDAVLPPICWVNDVADVIPSATDETMASQAISHFWSLQEVKETFSWDRIIDSNGDVEAARCHCLFWQPTDAEERTRQALQLMDVAGNSGIDAVVYHDSFPIHVSRWRLVKESVLQTSGWVLLSVLISLMVLLPARNAVLGVCNVTGVVLVLLGSMSIRGVTYNAITYTSCVMAIGFCVDYTCHIVHFSDHGVPPSAGWDVRMGHALRECGYDVLLGCITSLIGVVLLSFHTAACFRIVAHNAILIMTVGGFSAIWGLPSIMALWSRFMGAVGPGYRTSVERMRGSGREAGANVGAA